MEAICHSSRGEIAYLYNLKSFRGLYFKVTTVLIAVIHFGVHHGRPLRKVHRFFGRGFAQPNNVV